MAVNWSVVRPRGASTVGLTEPLESSTDQAIWRPPIDRVKRIRYHWLFVSSEVMLFQGSESSGEGIEEMVRADSMLSRLGAIKGEVSSWSSCSFCVSREALGLASYESRWYEAFLRMPLGRGEARGLLLDMDRPRR